LITSPERDILCEAHNGLSAPIVEEAGFRGISATGLTIHHGRADVVASGAIDTA
jgi:hypothetical protein